MNTAQFLAADPKVSAWVAASAGTGKTKVLTDRILNLLLHGCAPERILCLTFTKAAAAEMSNRLMQRLSVWATASEQELVIELQNLSGHATVDISLKNRARQLFPLVMDVPGGMKIQTIHAFCQSILNRFPLEAGVPPHFKVLDEILADQLLKEAQHATFLNPSPNAETALEILNPYMADQRFGSILKDVFQNRSRLIELLENYETIKDYTDYLIDYLHIESPSLKGEGIFKSTLIEELKSQFISSDVPYDTYIARYLTKKNEIRKKLLPDQMIEAERVHQFVRSLSSIELVRSTIAIITLFQEILRNYSERKLRKNVLDYDDLIDKTRRLLSLPDISSWVLYKLDGGLDHLLIDEAQDTNEDQWEIIAKLTSDFFSEKNTSRTIFAVGDAKQSIYSFQGANPEDFFKFKDHFAQLTRNVDQIWRDVHLDLSYRSTEAILTIVDEVFSHSPTKQGVMFDQSSIAHHVHREKSEGIVELLPLIEAEIGEKCELMDEWKLPLERIQRSSPYQLTAQYLADKVEGWLQSGDVLPSTNQPIQPRDILILMRKRTELNHEIIRAFKKRSIPVAGSDRLVLIDYIAVQDLLAVGQFILLPEDDLNLACILRSPLIGMREEDLYTLALGRDGSLWQSLKQHAASHSAFELAYKWLKSCLSESDLKPVYEFYSYVLTQGEGRRRFLSRLGQEVEEVIEEFLNQCLKFDQEHATSIQGFIHYMNNQSQEIKRDCADTISNQVRLMTIHGSKGLQSPIVIIPDAAEGGRDKREAILWGDNLMILRPRQEDETDTMCELKDGLARKAEEEKRRLLYVALTRAQDRLYVGGWKTGKDIPEDCWYSLIQKAVGSKPPNNGTYYGFLQKYNQQATTEIQMLEKRHELPAWAHQPPHNVYQQKMQSKTNRTISSKAIERGLIVHRLFEHLPQFPVDKRYAAACQLILQEKLPLSDWEMDIQATLEIINNPQHEAIFGPDSLAEVPISGYVEGKLFHGRIDRLVVSTNKVTIIDFKTDQEPPTSAAEIPREYMLQLEGYAKALRSLYPNHQIQKMLLWTSGPYIQMI